MNFELISTAFAQDAPAQRGPVFPWPLIIAIFAIFYFLIIRPQSKRQRETKTMLTSLSRGDRIVTIGGIVGTIVSIKESKDGGEETIILKVGENQKLELLKSSVAKVISTTSTEVKKET